MGATNSPRSRNSYSLYLSTYNLWSMVACATLLLPLSRSFRGLNADDDGSAAHDGGERSRSQNHARCGRCWQRILLT
jgi:hypothetical protein